MATSEKIEQGKGGRVSQRRVWQQSQLSTYAVLLICGCIFELLYVLIVALSPLPELHLFASPVATAWPWTETLSHLLFPAAWARPGNTSLTHTWPYLALLILTLFALIGTYALSIASVLQWQKHHANKAGRRWLLLLVVGVGIFGLTLLIQPTLFSDDVFTYIFSGRILSVYQADPWNTAPIQFPYDTYLQWVISGRALPNIYGPLWLYICSLLVDIGGGPLGTLLLFKGVAFASHLINCFLIWAIMGKIAPSRRLLGTLLYAWNPLAVIELTGSGHSEGVFIGLLLLTVLIYVHSRGRWHDIAVMALLGLAISLNLTALLIAPLLVWFSVRDKRPLQAFWSFCWRTIIGQGFVILLFLPLWRGIPTFFAITSAIDIPHFVHSPVGLLVGPVHWLFGLIAQWSNFPPVMHPSEAADLTLRISAVFIFTLIYFSLFGKVRNAAKTVKDVNYNAEVNAKNTSEIDQEMTNPGFDVLLNRWGNAVFSYLVLVMGWFWPWYALNTLWIAALSRFDVNSIALLIFSGTALLIYPLLDFAGSPLATFQPLLIFGIPLVYLFLDRRTNAGKGVVT